MLEAGARIDKWSVDRPLGEGGMGAVFACTDSVTGRIRAAVKIAKVGSSDDYKGRFLREVEALHSLQHRSIVRVTDWGEDPNHGVLFLAMDLLDGQDLEKRLGQGALSLDEARAIFDDVTDALAYAHESGVFHRDLKPANVMVPTKGPAKLVDFGIAMQESQSRMTAAGEVPGTPAYIAPEVLVGEVDPAKADIYAMGQILFECLTGGPAFPDKPGLSATHQLMHLMSAKSKQDPLDVGEAFPHPLRDLIWRATHPDPAQRPATARDLARELAASWAPAAAAPEAPAPPPPAPAPPAPPAPLPAPVIAAPAASGGGSRWLLVAGGLLALLALGGVGALALGGGAVLLLGTASEPEGAVATVGAPAEVAGSGAGGEALAEAETEVAEAETEVAEAETVAPSTGDEQSAPSRSAPPAATAPAEKAAAPTESTEPKVARVVPEVAAPPGAGGRIAFGGADVTGARGPVAIDKVVRGEQAALLKCYSDQLAGAPGLEGTLKVAFTVLPGGRTTSVNVRKNKIGSAGLDTCIEGQFTRMRFKARDDNDTAYATYTLTFSP